MWPAVIGAAGSLLGGILNRNAAKDAAATNRKWALQDQAEQFVRLRAAAEKGGFNPLSVLGAAPNSGMVSPTAAASQNYMGTAIADSALMLADSMSKREAEIRAKGQDLARQKAILVKKLADATLRPDQPGIFQRGANASKVPLAPYPYDSNGKVAGLWIGGAFVPRPLGFSSGSDIENELGDTVAAEAAVAPLATAYTAASVPILAHQAKLVETNKNSGQRGLSLDWRRRETSALNRGRAPLDLMFTGQGVVGGMPRNVVFR